MDALLAPIPSGGATLALDSSGSGDWRRVPLLVRWCRAHFAHRDHWTAKVSNRGKTTSNDLQYPQRQPHQHASFPRRPRQS